MKHQTLIIIVKSHKLKEVLFEGGSTESESGVKSASGGNTVAAPFS